MMTSLMMNKNNNLSKINFSAVITAAGSSKRMQSDKKKEYLSLPDSSNNSTILSETLFKFLSTNIFKSIVVTVPEEDLDTIQALLFKDERLSIEMEKSETELMFTSGASTRQASVFNALDALKNYNLYENKTTDFVLIHDGARPFLSTDLIENVCRLTSEKGSAIPASPAIDTQKVVDEHGKIIEHLKRSNIAAVQTPQGFDFDKLYKAHKLAVSSNKEYTDDSEIYALLEEEVFTCEGEIKNKKITYKEDLIKE